jgi:hypothetical protein
VKLSFGKVSFLFIIRARMMETLLEYFFIFVGGVLFLLVLALPMLIMLSALIAYLRYHMFGIHSPIIDDLFYRKSRLEITPPPSPLKGIAIIAAILGVVYWLSTW